MIDWTKGRLVDNYAIDATAGAPWATDKLYKPTVPTGKRWLFLGGHFNRDVASTAEVTIKNVANEVIWQIDSFASATTSCAFPSSQAQVNTINPFVLIVMDAGSYVQVSFATSQTGAAFASFNVIEVDA